MERSSPSWPTSLRRCGRFNAGIVEEFRANGGKVGGPFEVGTEAYEVTARELPAAERDEVFARVVAVAPGFGEYQAKTDRVIPLIELSRV